jgi:hypothetical protein
MARSGGPLTWTTILLYTLCIVTSALDGDFGSPGKRPTSVNGTASVNGTTFKNVAPAAGASCPAPGTKLSTSTGTLHRRAPSYNQLVAEGYNNFCLQSAFETQVDQSMWTYDELAQYGWVVAHRNSDALNCSRTCR